MKNHRYKVLKSKITRIIVKCLNSSPNEKKFINQNKWKKKRVITALNHHQHHHYVAQSA